MKLFTLWIVAFYFPAISGPNMLTYQGRLFDTNGEPVNTGTANITAQVLSASGNCLLFQEQHSVTMVDTDGFFKISLGFGVKETVTAPNFDIQNIFSNSTPLSNAHLGCLSPYVPSADEYRILRVSVNGETLVPDQIIGSAPFAFEAQKLGGESLTQVKDHSNKNLAGSPLPDLATTPLVAGDSFQWDGSKWVAFQAAPADLPTNSVTLDDVDFASSNGLNLPPLASDPISPVAGQTYYNTTINKMMIFNGSSWLELSSGSAAPISDYQVFTADGTWTKPSGFPEDALVIVQMWGGGGGGSGNAGGGGGAYVEHKLRLGDLGGTEAVVVGLGGSPGSGGGNSSFAGITAYRGGAGSSWATLGSGGGGGGHLSAGVNSNASSSGSYGFGGSPSGGGQGGSSNFGGGGGGSNSPMTGGSSAYGGGGGGGGLGGSYGAGGKSIYGGGGGSRTTGGTSIYGGNGGGSGTAGSIPGGGGGSNSAGARGEVRIRVQP